MKYTVRKLTPVECERLQGFPDNWTDIGGRVNRRRDGTIQFTPCETPDSPRYQALGNSFAVPVIKWLGERIEVVDKVLKEREANSNGNVLS